MTTPPALVAAVRHLLAPLVRVLVARGMTFPMLADLLKQIYVDVADREFRLEPRPPTDSRVSLLTGVHRKDVRRLRGAAAAPDRMPDSVALGAQLVAAWTSRRPFLDGKGRPKALPRLASRGGGASFEALVASVSKDIRPRSVLDEWIRLGVVEIDPNDRVVLRASAFVPARGFEEKAFYLGHNVHDHLAAAARNVLDAGPPFLERCVHYDALDPASVEKLAALAEESGMKALQAVNRKAMALEQAARKDASARQRITFGVYFFSAPVAETSERGPRQDERGES
jgi:hypothetical protein